MLPLSAHCIFQHGRISMHPDSQTVLHPTGLISQLHIMNLPAFVQATDLSPHGRASDYSHHGRASDYSPLLFTILLFVAPSLAFAQTDIIKTDSAASDILDHPIEHGTLVLQSDGKTLFGGITVKETTIIAPKAVFDTLPLAERAQTKILANGDHLEINGTSIGVRQLDWYAAED